MKIRSYLNVVVLVHVFERKADGARCRVPPSSSTNAATTLSSLSPWIELISICGPPLATEPGARFNAPHPHLPSPSTKGLPSLLCMTSLRNLSRQHKVVDCFCYRPGRVYWRGCAADSVAGGPLHPDRVVNLANVGGIALYIPSPSSHVPSGAFYFLIICSPHVWHPLAIRIVQ